MLRDRTHDVRRWVSKAVAHRDERLFDGPSLDELHDCVDVIFDLFNKYGALIRGVSTTRGVILQGGWMKVFTVPWLPDEDTFRDVVRSVDEREQLDLQKPHR